MSGMLPVYVVLDLETASATPTHDRIAEIDLIRYEKMAMKLVAGIF